MMSFLNPDLAKILTEERRARAMAKSSRRRALLESRELGSRTEPPEAVVIELTFGTACDQIGA
jgi:hypothetical protein